MPQLGPPTRVHFWLLALASGVLLFWLLWLRPAHPEADIPASAEAQAVTMAWLAQESVRLLGYTIRALGIYLITVVLIFAHAFLWPKDINRKSSEA